MNDVFEKISKTISDTSKVVTEKTKQVGEVAKLNAKIVSSEHTISENYTILGKFYYDKYKDNPDEGAIVAVNSITAANDAIAEMKAQLLSIRGAVACQSCGCECPIEDSYCGKCGALLEKPEPPVNEEEIVVEVTAEDNAPADDDETPASDTTEEN